MHEHCLIYRVPYADVDQMGVVYYANYLVYFERGRNELLRCAGLPYLELERREAFLPVIEAHCEYLKPARYDDELQIIARADEIAGIRLKMSCEIRRNDEILARGYTWHVTTNAKGRPVRVPEELQKLFRAPA